jgi:hypothetical protein
VGRDDGAHALTMTPVPSAPPPGSMTVPPLFGWEHILVALALIALAGLAGLVLLAAGRAAGSRNDWQAWLDGRSAQRREGTAVGSSPGERGPQADELQDRAGGW